ncbi:MAG: ParM/StbA family protein [Pleurocapsa sp. MO_226.B13]|nr:ParM/StbA family protein [Pleurocapsa sp. MO_226.B13]
MNKRTSKLTLICDPGTSLIKVLYRVGRKGQLKHLTMDAQILKLDGNLVTNLNKSSEFGKPEDNAWLQTYDRSCYLVGRLAREYRASTSIKSLKYESIVPKILAIIGAIAVKEKLSQSLQLDLAVLLPYGELSNNRAMEKELRSKIEEFEFQGETYRVEIQKYRFSPEGLGIASHLFKKKSRDRVQSQTLAILMFGYRNTSLLLFKDGTLSVDRSETTKLGFYNFSDRIIKQTSGLSREDIQSAIYTCSENFINHQTALGEERMITTLAVEELVKSRDKQRAEAEKKSLETAIANSRKEYWQLIEAWLGEVLPTQRHLDELIYTGGTSGFFRQELNDYLSDKYSNIEVSSTEKMERELQLELNLSEVGLEKFKQQQLPLRFADTWGLFIGFTRYTPTALCFDSN